MKSWLVRCALGGLVLASPALAQEDDAPYAYPDEEQPQQETSSRSRYSDPGEEFREAAEEPEGEGFRRLSRLDDPNVGVVGEVLAGALLLDSPKGAFAETGLGLGLRFTWEFGRLLDSETLNEALWGDVRWTWGGMSDGTEFLQGRSSIHYFTVAPAYELRLLGSFGLYGQVGGGAALQVTSLTVGGKETAVNGLKPVFQYGVGLRGRPRLTESLSLALRLEATRFRRGYMDDTFIGASVGTAF